MLCVRWTLVASLLLVLTPAPAAAGGWWTFVDMDRSTVAVGQKAKVRTQVMFSSIEAARDARDEGQFYVYALRGVDDAMLLRAMNKPFRAGWWSLEDADAVKLGRVVLRVTNANLAWARASFTVPDLPPASYDLMLCDAGCARPLADVIPTSGFTVAADPATAKLAARADRLQDQLLRLEQRLAGERRASRAAEAQAEVAREGIEERLRLLSLVAAEDSPDSSPWTFVPWLLAGMFLGALAAMALRRVRSLGRPGNAAESWKPSDEELRDLLSSERSPR
jgi:hypothetical protein